MIDAYPLHWPAGYKRTPTSSRTWSRFDQTYDKAQRFLHEELGRLRAKDIIVSTNLRVRRDGMLYADELNRKIDDPGVAIYFKYKGKDVSMCCDKYNKVWENIYALGKGIEALRGMERWGVSEFLERMFTGFTALSEQSSALKWWEVLELERPTRDIEIIRDSYLFLAKQRHPDKGGTTAAFQELQEAYMQAMDYADN